jgi:hypothetical protein
MSPGTLTIFIGYERSGNEPRGDVGGCERERPSRSQRNHAASAISARPTTPPTTPPTIAPMLVELPLLEEDDVVAAAAVEEVVDADVDNAVAVAVLGDDVVDSGD